jgi:hypothetical protein
MLPFTNYKLATEKDEGLGGTLFWEFGNKVANMLAHDEDILVMMEVQICIRS